MSFVTTYQGSVNRWECDENDHQNVRFYLAKAKQGLLIALQKWQLAEHADCTHLMTRIRSHHIRFLREARVAVPQVIECGMLEFVPQQSMRVLANVNHAGSGERQATFVTEFDLRGVDCAPYQGTCVDLPGDAGSRGVPAATPPYAGFDHAQALAQGFQQCGAGIIAAAECDATGALEPEGYIGRVSDSMPNLWALMRYDANADDADAAFGGSAVLEYRLQLHRALRVGDAFVHLSGIHSLGAKTWGLSHLMFHAASGQLAASAEAVGLAMDLTTRRAIAIPDTQRSRMQALQIRTPSAEGIR